MASIEAKNIRTFLTFNLVYLICTGWLISSTNVIFTIKSQYSLTFDGCPAFMAAAVLSSIVVFLAVLISIFGFFTCYLSNNPKLYLTYGVLILICLLLQIITGFTARRAGKDLLVKKILQSDLPNFESIDYDLQEEIQIIQQKFDCCGYEGEEERGYENYYDPLTEKDPASKIPNSCCDKFEPGYVHSTIGDCLFKEYSKRKGCGRILLNSYKNLFGNTTFNFSRDLGTMFVVLFNIFQVIVAGFSIYVEVSVQEEARRKAIYKPGD